MDCSGHPTAGPEGIEFLRDGGTYVEMGQFTDAGSIMTSWHRFCRQGHLGAGLLGLHRQRPARSASTCSTSARDKYPWRKMQTLFPFTVDGRQGRGAQAMAMKTVKSTIVPFEELL